MRWIIFQKLVLYVLQYGVRKENEAHVGNAYYLEREFFVIDTEEYLKCLGIAAKNLHLQKFVN